jgi:hypothetical protein
MASACTRVRRLEFLSFDLAAVATDVVATETITADSIASELAPPHCIAADGAMLLPGGRRAVVFVRRPHFPLLPVAHDARVLDAIGARGSPARPSQPQLVVTVSPMAQHGIALPAAAAAAAAAGTSTERDEQPTSITKLKFDIVVAVLEFVRGDLAEASAVRDRLLHHFGAAMLRRMLDDGEVDGELVGTVAAGMGDRPN